MNERRNREIEYNMIINKTRGKSYLIEEAIIKEEQCSKCIKRGSIKYCRLNIDPEKRVCRNYKGV